MVKINRDQIAAFVGDDPRTIKAIEDLVVQTNENTDTINLSFAVEIGGAISVGNQGLAEIEGLKSLVAPLVHTPPDLGGTVTSIIAGTGLNGGTITTSGTIALADTAVTAGAYGSASEVASFTVDAQGRLTAAADITITPAAIGAVPTSRTLTAGDGLTGGGDLSANRTFNVGAGTGITVNANDVALTVQTAHGTYTPTLTNVANLDASTAYSFQYLRVGNTVTVSGRVDVDPTLTATSTQLGISLPVASNLANANECAGTAFAPAISGQGAAILGDAVNNRAQMEWVSGDITNQAMYINFSYRVI